MKWTILCVVVEHSSLTLYAKFDENLLTAFKIAVKKLLAYFFVDTLCILTYICQVLTISSLVVDHDHAGPGEPKNFWTPMYTRTV